MTTRELEVRGYTIPRGFDFECSVPSVFVPVIGDPLAPAFLEAACYHDYRYTIREGSRALADYDFYMLLLENGVPDWRAELMYLAVRVYGAHRWEDPADLAYRAERDRLELEADELLSV